MPGACARSTTSTSRASASSSGWTSTSRWTTARITDDARIRAALPTLEELREQGAAKLVLLAAPRPARRTASRSSRCKPVAERLSELLGAEVALAPDLDDVPDGDVVMLENVRYEPGETKNDPELAKRYAALADVYVNDAFGAAHRAHASTEAVAHLLPSRGGPAAASARSRRSTGILEDPQRPLVAVVGGAKVTDKIGVLDAFLERADTRADRRRDVLPVLRRPGPRGRRLAVRGGGRRARAARARRRRRQAAAARRTSSLGREFAADTEVRELDGVDVPDGWMGLDIGPRHRRALRAR